MGLFTLNTPPFEWMKSWLNAYSKDNDLDVDKIMDWINHQPMTNC